jgi:PPE-repeat protein
LRSLLVVTRSVLDFGALPPEINSTRMYTGPGAGPLIEAAAAWQALAAGLLAGGTAMAGVTGALVGGPWLGPSSMMMGLSSTQFVAWVLTTAATAEKAAALAAGAVDAYGTAFTATIPPPEVARNQATTAMLIATNFMGINSAAIAASEAQYQEYWAQDASAMYAYAAENQAIAASLAAPPFLPVIPNTNPAGLAAQAASVGQAAGTDAGQAAATASQAGTATSQMGSGLGSLSSVMQAPMQAMSAIPQALQQLSQPLSQVGQQFGSFLQPLMSMFPQMLQGMGTGISAGAGSLGSLGSLGTLGSPGGSMMPAITASMGRSGSLGSLSAPLRLDTMREGWADTAPVTRNAVLTGFTPEGFVAQEDTGGAAMPMRGGMPLAGMMPPQGGFVGQQRRVLPGADIYRRPVF